MENYEIDKFLEKKDYDIRKSGNARWIDQKCTPDVINVIADCVLNYYEQNGDIEFTSRDIWESEYSGEVIELYFNKPHPKDPSTNNEYDKFFAQPLELLSYSDILNKEKKGNRNYYTINNLKLLEYISLTDKNTYTFLVKYIEKVLEDSNIIEPFDLFFEHQNKSNYNFLKRSFSKFIISNTKINKETEVNRIFIKVINPLACFNKKLGTRRGTISNEIIYYSDLLYNSLNFRDIYADKPKGISRKNWRKQQEEKPSINIDLHKSNKAVKFLHKFNEKNRDGYTEVYDKHEGLGTQMHHIFPKNEFKEISYFYENIISLTPTQHLTYAHPKNNTNLINIKYQKFILEEKATRIQENITNNNIETIYSFDRLIEVLNEGFNKNYEEKDNNYKNSLSIIKECYENIL